MNKKANSIHDQRLYSVINGFVMYHLWIKKINLLFCFCIIASWHCTDKCIVIVVGIYTTYNTLICTLYYIHYLSSILVGNALQAVGSMQRSFIIGILLTVNCSSMHRYVQCSNTCRLSVCLSVSGLDVQYWQLRPLLLDPINDNGTQVTSWPCMSLVLTADVWLMMTGRPWRWRVNRGIFYQPFPVD